MFRHVVLFRCIHANTSLYCSFLVVTSAHQVSGKLNETSRQQTRCHLPHKFLAWHCWKFFRSPALLYPSSAMSRAVTLVVFSGTVFSCVRKLAQGKHDTAVTCQWLKRGFFLLTFRSSVAVALMVGVFGSVRARINGAKYLLSWVDQYTSHFLPIYEVRKIFCFLQIDKMRTQGVCWDINKRVDWLLIRFVFFLVMKHFHFLTLNNVWKCRAFTASFHSLPFCCLLWREEAFYAVFSKGKMSFALNLGEFLFYSFFFSGSVCFFTLDHILTMLILGQSFV